MSDLTVTPGGLMQALTELARDPNFDGEKFKLLADLQLKLEDRQAERMLTQDLQAIQRAVPAIPKRGLIDLGKGKIPYALYPDVMNALQPLLDQYGMTVTHTMIPSPPDKMIIRTTTRHPMGASLDIDILVPVDMGPGRNATQAHMSSEAYGQRRGVKATFNIRDENAADDDGSSSHMKFITEAQAQEIEDLITKSGRARDSFLRWANVADVTEITAARFIPLKNALLAALKAKGE